MTRILLSSYRVRSASPPPPSGPVLWPRWVGGRIRMIPIPAERIPAGWQSVNIRVPSRPATCEETDCPAFLEGWTEVTPGGAIGSEVREGHITADEAAATFGLYGPKSIPPTVVHHPAGTACPRKHRTASGLPPVYIIDGRTVLWNEFEDAIAGGLETAHAIAG